MIRNERHDDECDVEHRHNERYRLDLGLKGSKARLDEANEANELDAAQRVDR